MFTFRTGLSAIAASSLFLFSFLWVLFSCFGRFHANSAVRSVDFSLAGFKNPNCGCSLYADSWLSPTKVTMPLKEVNEQRQEVLKGKWVDLLIGKYSKNSAFHCRLKYAGRSSLFDSFHSPLVFSLTWCVVIFFSQHRWWARTNVPFKMWFVYYIYKQQNKTF